MTTQKIGVLLTNTGTPEAPTPAALKKYLRAFLSDRRVIDLPALLWKPLLHGFILPIRSKYSAKLYRKIWQKEKSPMLVMMECLQSTLKQKLKCPIEIGMHYSKPSMMDGLVSLKNEGVTLPIVLPLFPQFSYTTTASSYDRIMSSPFSSALFIPIMQYANHPLYLSALVSSVKRAWQAEGKGNHLVISFHGIPTRLMKKGDPYPVFCLFTAQMITQRLGLAKEEWTLCYQSRFGFAKWLQPATTDILMQLANQGVKRVDVLCPGFSVDCLETLEEIAIRGKETFLKYGGEKLNYIPALNDSSEHIALLMDLIQTSSQ